MYREASRNLIDSRRPRGDHECDLSYNQKVQYEFVHFLGFLRVHHVSRLFYFNKPRTTIQKSTQNAQETEVKPLDRCLQHFNEV